MASLVAGAAVFVASALAPPGALAESTMEMSKGMTMAGFDPNRYAGVWYEVASMKRGFAGEGQGDCHCTTGVYTYLPATQEVRVDTFCVHGSPDGKLSGIRGRVTCLSMTEAERRATMLERDEMVDVKCFLRFPSIPFIPGEPYDVIDTDYSSYALVQGSKDRSFVQIYSRTPRPGTGFIKEHKARLGELGWDVAGIKDTPQDCPDAMMSSDSFARVAQAEGMDVMMENTVPAGVAQKVALEANGGGDGSEAKKAEEVPSDPFKDFTSSTGLLVDRFDLKKTTKDLLKLFVQ